MSYMAFDVEQFFQSIDIILTQRLSNLSYNTTVIATIIDDSDKQKGHYIVSDGTIKFDAYTNDINYKIDDQVRITILNGDWSQKKFIEGKYVDGDGISVIPYIPPLGTTMQDNQSTLDTIDDFVLYANYSNPKTIWSKKITPDSEYYTLQSNGIYNVITLQGDFQTEFFNESEIASGNYGLLLELFIQPEVNSNKRIRKYITFDSSEMIGNPYSFIIDSHQEKQITVASEGIVTEIILSIYQARQFTVDDNRILIANTVPFKTKKGNELLGADKKNPIWFKNITIGFGSDLTKIEDNSLKLYTTSSSIYHYKDGIGDETNDKFLGFVWYNKNEHDGYIGFSDGIVDLDKEGKIIPYDEINYNEISYADNRLMNQKGKGIIPTDKISLTLAANIDESEKYMVSAYEALTTNLSQVLQTLARYIAETDLIKDLNKIITVVNEEKAILVKCQDIAKEATQNLVKMYDGVLKYGYNIQNDTGEAQWDKTWNTADYYNIYIQAFTEAFTEIEDFLKKMQTQTAAGQILSGYKGVYNTYAPKIRKEIAAIKVSLDQIVHTVIVDEEELEDVAVLKTYKNKSEYVEYGNIDLSQYANKYSVYWYRYKEGYKLNYIAPITMDEWKELQTKEHDTYEEYLEYCFANNKEYQFANFLGTNWERILVDSNFMDEQAWEKDKGKYETYEEYVEDVTLKNFGLPTEIGQVIEKDDKQITYYPHSPSSAQILYRRMDPRTPEERYQVVLFYNHEMIVSNVITFINTEADSIPDEFKVDANDTLKIEHGTYSQDHYQSYSSAFDLVNIADESRSRQLRVSYDGILVGDEALAGAGIYWYIPTTSTMLTYDINYLINDLGFNSDGISSISLTLSGEKDSLIYTYSDDLLDTINLSDGTIKNSKIEAWDKEKKTITLNKSLGELKNVKTIIKNISNKTPYSRNGYIYFYKEIRYDKEQIDAVDIDGNVIKNADGTNAKDWKITLEEIDRQFAYKIKPYYEASAQNNTIQIEAHVIGTGGKEKVTKGEISFTFSTFGSNGTKYTFVMTPATTQVAVLSDSDETDDEIDGDLNLILSLRNAENELIEMTDKLALPEEGEEEISPYSLEVKWYAKVKDEDVPSPILYQPIAESKQWSVNIPINKNDNKYMGIAEASVEFQTEGRSEQEKRIIKLSHLYPVAFSDNKHYYMSGPTSIVYNNQGTLSRLNEEPFKLYAKYVDSGKKDSDGNIIFEENVEVENQVWSLVYYDNAGNRITKNNNQNVLAYMPILNSDNTLTPAPMFFSYENDIFYIPVAICKVKGKIVWTQPIIITQNQYASSTLNEWNGKFEIDEENGTIMSTMLGAGIKTENNTFEGVLMGDIAGGGNFSPDNETGIGIYGFNDGAQSFYLGVNGKAFFGKAGRGRIIIDGDKGTIGSASYHASKKTAGMLIDLDDGYIDMRGATATNSDYNSKQKAYTGDGYQAHITLNALAKDNGDPYFRISTPNKDKNSKWNNKDLIHIGLDGYYLQTENYIPGSFNINDGILNNQGSGTKIDLYGSSIDSYNLKLISKNIYLDSTVGSHPYFVIKSDDGNNLFYVSQDNYYLKTNNYSESVSGTKINLTNGLIDSYNFKLKGGSLIGSHIILNSNPGDFDNYLDIGNSTNYIKFSGSGSLSMASQNFDLTTKADGKINIYISDTGQGFKINEIDRDNIVLKMGEYFGVSSSGDLYSASGNIGGWTINKNMLSAEGITLHSDGSISSVPEKNNGNSVKIEDGVITAVGANITGTIKAKTGTIGGWIIGNVDNTTKEGSTLQSANGNIVFDSTANGSIVIKDVCTINSGGISILKGSISLGGGVTEDGEEIKPQFMVTNSGDVTIKSGTITVGDTMIKSDGFYNRGEDDKFNVPYASASNVKVFTGFRLNGREGWVTLDFVNGLLKNKTQGLGASNGGNDPVFNFSVSTNQTFKIGKGSVWTISYGSKTGTVDADGEFTISCILNPPTTLYTRGNQHTAYKKGETKTGTKLGSPVTINFTDGTSKTYYEAGSDYSYDVIGEEVDYYDIEKYCDASSEISGVIKINLDNID